MILCYIIGHRIRNVIENSTAFDEWYRHRDTEHPICLRCGKVFK